MEALEAQQPALPKLGEEGQLKEVGLLELLALAGQSAGVQHVAAVLPNVLGLVGRSDVHLSLSLVPWELFARLHLQEQEQERDQGQEQA